MILQMHLGWRLYRLRNVPPTWCYRAINYVFTPVGSETQFFLTTEAVKDRYTELKDGKDQYVEFGYDTTSQEFYWSAVDVKNSMAGDNKFGCKINFCLCVDVVRLSVVYEKTHDVPRFSTLGERVAPNILHHRRGETEDRGISSSSCRGRNTSCQHSGKTNAGHFREIFRALRWQLFGR